MPTGNTVARTASPRQTAYFQRYEPRCRDDDFSHGLECRTADPLWFLARQWMVGEFQGQDAGSPVRVDVTTQTCPVKDVELASSGVRRSLLGDAPPIEALVEHEQITPSDIDWRMRVQIGQQYERLLRAELRGSAAGVTAHLREKCPIHQPAGDQRTELDRATQRFVAVMAGRAMDGGALLEAAQPTQQGTYKLPPSLSSGIADNAVDAANNALTKLMAWFEALYGKLASHGPSAWVAPWLEYAFKTRADIGGNESLVLTADDYRNGALDWPVFSLLSEREHTLPSLDDVEVLQAARVADVGVPKKIDPNAWQVGEVSQHFVPMRVSFYGMPKSRWWAFEDSRTDFGALDAAPTDLAKLMIMDFALLYGNDWFMVPLPLEVGTLTRIAQLKVTDVFGVETRVSPARSASDIPGQSWQMFGLSVKGSPNDVGDFLFLPPVVGFREESPPLEEVRLFRDEMANMVWAVEHTIMNGLGQPVGGFEEHVERRSREKEAAIEAVMAELAPLKVQMHQLIQELDALIDGGAATPEGAEAQITALQTQIAELSRIITELQAKIAAISDSGQAATVGSPKSGLPQYRLATTVPDNWIPYVPVRLPGSPDQVYLRQAKMLRNETDDEPSMIGTLSRLLTGRGGMPALERLREEAVTRAGQKLQLTRQRTRWLDGRTCVWMGRSVLPGKGEGSSGLRFDVLRNSRKAEPV